MKIKNILAAAFTLLTISIPTAYAWDIKTMNKQIDTTNVLVNDGCSGTVIAPNLILTAAHCIIDQYKVVEKEIINDDGTVKKEKFRIAVPGSVAVKTYDGPVIVQTTKYAYQIKKSDMALDLALLKTKAKMPDGKTTISCTEPERGSEVYAVGNPFGALYSSVTKGIVSSLSRSYLDLGIAGDLGDPTDSGEHGLVQHSAVIAGGSSGGALYNNDGELIGVNVRGARTGGVSLSVPLSDIHKFLNGELETCNAPLAR